jgi:hypothetical protein
MEAKKALTSVLSTEETSTPVSNRRSEPDATFWHYKYEELAGLHSLYVRTVNEQLTNRFPLINDLEDVSTDEVRVVCRFALAAVPLIQETWLTNIEAIGKHYGSKGKNIFGRKPSGT